MAAISFLKYLWKERKSEYPNRRRLTPTTTTNVYTVSREEGIIQQEGDPWSPGVMNNLEDRISNAITGLNGKIDRYC